MNEYKEKVKKVQEFSGIIYMMQEISEYKNERWSKGMTLDFESRDECSGTYILD